MDKNLKCINNFIVPKSVCNAKNAMVKFRENHINNTLISVYLNNAKIVIKKFTIKFQNSINLNAKNKLVHLRWLLMI